MIWDISLLEILALVLCFILSGAFSGSEAVLMSISIDRAKQLIDSGGPQGKALSFMVSKPNELLTTILVGNNIVNILAAALTTTIMGRIFQSEVIGISTGITTIIILFFGEIIPKTFARRHAEFLSLYVIFILKIIYYSLYPIIKSTVLLIKYLIGENMELSGRVVTKNDIEYMINKAEKERTIDSKQLNLLSSIMEFPTIKVKDIMIPRLEVKFLQANYSFQELMDEIKEDHYSRYPVCEGELENTIGFLHIKDLAFVRGIDKRNFDVRDLVKELFFVYEHMKIQAVFDYMNKKKVHLALVKDENDLVVGIVTLEDIIEEIVGEIQDEHDEEEIDNETLSKYSEGITIEANTSLRELYAEYNIKIPLNNNYSTLAGFLLDMLGNRFPEKGQFIVWDGFSFELVLVDDHVIKEVRIRSLDKANDDEYLSGEENHTDNVFVAVKK